MKQARANKLRVVKISRIERMLASSVCRDDQNTNRQNNEKDIHILYIILYTYYIHIINPFSSRGILFSSPLSHTGRDQQKSVAKD